MKNFLLISILFLTPLAATFAEWAPQEIKFSHRDGTVLAGLFQKPDKNQPTVILLHGLRSSKHEWSQLALALAEKGWGVLIYDARGHGESSRTKDSGGNPTGYLSFGNPGPGSPWETMIEDVGAAIQYLVKEKDVNRRNLFLGGASLGANVVFNYAAHTYSLKGVLLLSPGLSYMGIRSDDVSSLVQKIPVLIVVHQSDYYAYESSQKLIELNNKIELWTDVKAGHGVQMFDKILIDRLVAWFEDKKLKN